MRIEEYIAVGCTTIQQIDFGLAEARAECNQVQSDYARLQQFPNLNPLIKTTTKTVIIECGKIQA
jgi:hypothetical protein